MQNNYRMRPYIFVAIIPLPEKIVADGIHRYEPRTARGAILLFANIIQQQAESILAFLQITDAHKLVVRMIVFIIA
jgi:hypothetical protein